MLDAGADEALVRGVRSEAVLGENALDVVIDFVGGEEWPELLNILRLFGGYAVPGATAGPIVTLDLRTIYLEDQQFVGCTVLNERVFPDWQA